MRKINYRIFIVFLITLFYAIPALCVQKGQVQYSIPIDYSVINEQELNAEAEDLFQQFLNTDDEKQKQILLAKLLSDYCILGEIDKSNPLYFTRLGIIYDKLGKDRYAKSNFYRSSNLTPNYPYAFFSFGNYFYDRKEFKKALREYKKALDAGYDSNYDTLYQIGTIYEKYGDFSEAIKFYKRALVFNDSDVLRAKILKLEELLEQNSLYNQRQRIDK